MARIEPRTFSFEDLIDQVRQGVLRCPRFQRRFVWRGDQVLEFFDSVRLRYPVGSLLIWRTRERYSSFDRVGPIDVPPDQPRAPAEVGYVLDGHQRISVLFGVFALDDAAVERLKGTDRLFLVYFDLEAERFIHTRFVEDHHLPVRYLLGRDDRLTSWIDERRDRTSAGTPPRARWDTFRRRALQLQTTFAQYRLPYLDVTEASLDEAVQVFVRVNSQGTSVKRAEVFAALTWRPDSFDFAAQARALLDEHPRYNNFGTEPVLRSLLAALGESLYADNWEDVLEAHRHRLPETMEEISLAFGRALEFLDHGIGASSGKVVPYSLHIVLLTEFFRLCPDPGEKAREELTRWLWATSFASGYASGGNLRFNEAVDSARRLARGEAISLLPQRLRLQPFPRRFHPKSARVRVFHLFLKTLRPRDLVTGEPIESTRLLRNGMADARSIVPSGDQNVWRLASRLLVPATRSALIAGFKKLMCPIIDLEVDYGDPFAKSFQILATHIISPEAAVALERGDLEAFLDLREHDLIRAEQEFARQYVDLPPPGEEVVEEVEVDVEDESEPDL